MTQINLDLLSLIDDSKIKLYRPDWNQFTGDIKATLFLQQVLYWWNKKNGQPFWKFSSPCKHRWYKHGDSWQEELGFTRHELNKARSRISKKVKTNTIIKSAFVTYWTDSDNVTWYLLNPHKLISSLPEIHPAKDKWSVGIQMPMPETGNRKPETGNRDSKTRKPETGGPTIAKTTTTKTTTKTTTTTTPTPQTAVPDSDTNVVAVVVDEFILDWMGFVGQLKESEKNYATPPYLLAWAWYVKIKQATDQSLSNPIGIFRKHLPSGQWPNSQLKTLAVSWLEMNNRDKLTLIECLEFADSSGYLEISDNFPYEIDAGTLRQIWQATSGHPTPPHLMPTIEDNTESTRDYTEPPEPPELQPYQVTLEDKNLWNSYQEHFIGKLGKADFNTWLKPANVQSSNGRIHNILARNGRAVDYINEKRSEISEVLGHNNWSVIVQ